MAKPPQFERPPRAARSADPRYITLYIGEATKRALKAVRAYPDVEMGGMSRSARINAICERYAHILAGYMPTLDESEWCGLMAIFEGGITKELFESLRTADHGLFEHVRNAHEAGAAREWNYDQTALEKTLGEWHEDVLYAVVEIVDRFWATDLKDGRSPRQRLEDCGAKIGPQR